MNMHLEEIFHIFQAADPDPKTELAYTNDFTFLVAIVLSAQATDVGVNKATGPLFKTHDTPQKILKLGEDGLKKYIKTIGLYNAKAKNVMALCRMLIDQHDGKVPRTREALEALPGVGRKTASVWLNIETGEHTIAVDTHVFRVSHRLGIADGKTPDQVQAQLEARIPDKFLQHAHHWLILHGRYVCVARAPKCHNCRVEKLCPKIGVTAIAPGMKKPKSPTATKAKPLKGPSKKTGPDKKLGIKKEPRQK